MFGLEDGLYGAQMGGLGDDKKTEQSAIQAYLGLDEESLPHHRPQSRRLPLGVVAIIAQGRELSNILQSHFLSPAIEKLLVLPINSIALNLPSHISPT